ncbi:MAG: response regulator [Myxococcaceae bacterium]|nr:response regulator [Myxococcaceae bacterium]
MRPERTVVVVDDDATLRESVCEFLEDDGYHTISLGDAREALSLLEAHTEKPDIILLDLEMPGMTGWEFRQAQLQNPELRKVPVVAITGAGELHGLQVDEVVKKPFRLEELTRAMKRHESPPASPAPPRGRRADDVVDVNKLFAGSGVMGELMRAKDWSQTPLGPVPSWSPSLRTTVSLCLGSNFPFCLAWGPNRVMIYNDGYLPICGDKHPHSLGQDFATCWASAWPAIGNAFEGALRGETSYLENQRMFLDRHGFLEETFFTFAFSPVRDENGGVGGALNPCTENTHNVLSERRMSALRDVSERIANAKSTEEVFALAAQTLEGYSLDVPFALFYAVDHQRRRANLISHVGLPPGTTASSTSVALNEDGPDEWPIAEALRHGGVHWVTDLTARFGPITCGPYPEAPTQAQILPIRPAGHAEPAAFFIAGVSARLLLNEPYRGFFNLLAAAITTGLANAQAYESQRRRAEALAEVDRVKTRFFSNVSHEFRTPLTLMLGPLEELLSGCPGELNSQQRPRVQMVRRNALRLQKLVSALLDFSRAEAGRMRAHFEPVDLELLTRELVSAFGSAIERTGLALKTHFLPLDEPVYVDRDMWEKIVLNLVSNAFKFTFEGSIEVSLIPHKGYVVFEVKDTGVGILEEELPRIFERFYRVQDTRGRTHEGSGVGLALVHELVKLHGGSVAVDSHLGQGSTFSVLVPTGADHLPAGQVGRSQAPPSDGQAQVTALFVEEVLGWLPDRPPRESARPEVPFVPAPRQHPEHTLGTRRILLADDNADMRDYVRRLLQRHWDVEVVENGQLALEHALANPPDLILTDVMMPGLDGFSLLHKLRQAPQTQAIPVMMLSARAGEEATVESLQAGAEDYLTKPFSPRELLARVNTQLELAALRNEISHQRDRLYDMFMQAPAAICVIRGPDFVYEMANDTYVRVMGRDVLNKPLAQVVPELVEQGFVELLREVVRTGEPLSGNEVVLRFDRDGDGVAEDTYWNFTFVPFREPGTDVDRVIAYYDDVTERVQARTRLEQTLRHNEIFAGILAHDLRNPLGAILAAAQILLGRQAKAGERVTRPLHRILSSGDRMNRMIEQLLDFTRIRVGGGFELSLQPSNLADICHHVVAELEVAHQEHAIRIDTLGECSGHWDTDRLLQVVSNLTANAIGHGAPETDVHLTVDGTHPDRVSLSVHNTGSIAPGLLPTLFDAFRRGRTRGEQSAGLGLGLFITQQIVIAHGGTLTVESTDEAGTTFSLELRRGTAPPALPAA